ncbi:MAG: tripartite tricarboxylate transporter TctB family protein [Tropicimonas sp.]|uniref:tripartite tricarboxylate transporter TctB family protein n=1 Tax=Tropicimonas sp. TaxID=2067044 RepID=UPI003A85C33A
MLRLEINRVFGFLAIACGAVLIWQRPQATAAAAGEPGPAYFPMIVAGLLILLGIVFALVPAQVAVKRDADPDGDPDEKGDGFDLRMLVVFAALTLAYAGLFTTLGFHISTALYLVSASYLLSDGGLRALIGSAVFAILGTLVFGIALTRFFGAFLPEASFL